MRVDGKRGIAQQHFAQLSTQAKAVTGAVQWLANALQGQQLEGRQQVAAMQAGHGVVGRQVTLRSSSSGLC